MEMSRWACEPWKGHVPGSVGEGGYYALSGQGFTRTGGKGMSSGSCRWLWYVDCFPSKYVYYPGLEGLLKIISVIICFGNVYGQLTFIVFLQISALLQFSFSELK